MLKIAYSCLFIKYKNQFYTQNIIKKQTFDMIDKKQLKTYDKISQLPATLQQRKCTDVLCLVVGIAFTVIMLIIASACYNHQTFLKSNFPADTDGSLCGHELPQFQYLYFANLPQIKQRVCVSQCPKKDDTKLKCSPTSNVGCKISQSQKFSARFYESTPYQTRGGFFCWPVSQQLQQQINKRSNLQQRNSFYNSIDTIKYSLYIAVLISIIYFLLVQFLPTQMNFISVGLGIIVLLITIICLFTYSTQHTKIKIVFGILLVLLFIFFALTIYKHWDSLHLHSIYLKWSTRMFADRKLSLLYVLIFVVILFCFIGILIWEFTGFWTIGHLNFDPSYQIYHQLTGAFPTVMTFFMVIQLIWGLSFVKQAFNFCVSGNAAHWFLQQGKSEDHPNVKKSVWYPAKVMILKHIGTVIAGAFMTGFLNIFDAIFDFLRPSQANNQSFYNKCFSKACFCCNEIFDFVRSDALAYVNLAGNPYCNSSRYCQLLCRKSITVEYAQSSSRIYRLSAHFLVMGIVGVIALYMKGNISLYAEIIILVETIFISTMFISYHADTAEAIQITLLTIEQLYYLSHKTNSSNHAQDLSLLKNQGIRTELIQQIAQERKKRNQLKKQKEAGNKGLF